MENNNFENENREQETKENAENSNQSMFSETHEPADNPVNQESSGQDNYDTSNNTYQDNTYTNNVYEDTMRQNNAYQGNVYQNNMNPDSMYQNSVNQGNIYQNSGYQGYPYQNGVYQPSPNNMPHNAAPTPVHKKAKPGNNGFKRVLSYVLVGVICATLGGAVTTAGVLYVLPKTSAFQNTPFYKAVASNSSSGGTTVVNALPTLSKSSGLTIAEIAKKVAPAVVEVDVKTTAQSSNSSSYGWPFGSQQQQSQEEEGVGSGIIYNKDGYILTNYHVVTADSSTIASSITVTFSNGKTSAAKVVNFDSTEDLAVLKVTTNMEMPGVAELGDSSRLQVGDSVVAIGNPLGKDLVGTVTSGIVSAVNRKVTIDNKTLTLIQTDAAINEGNSGGPLVNSLGQVIGINSAKMNGTGIEGIGFSIPINTVKSELEGLQQSGLTLGIGAEDITSDEAQQYNVPQGILIDTVDSLSAAGKAGIQKNDIITQFDGQKVTTLAEINKIKFKHKSGDTIKIVVYRNSKYVTLSLTFSAS